jgi:hypothetical protein
MIATQASIKDAEGITTVIQIDGTAATDDTDLGPPPTGEVWEILAAWGLHDNAVAKACAWTLSDGVTADMAEGAKSMAALLPLSVYSNDANVSVLGQGDWKQPIRLNAACYLTYRAVGMEAGKKGYIKAIIRKFRGIESWSNV